VGVSKEEKYIQRKSRWIKRGVKRNDSGLGKSLLKSVWEKSSHGIALRSSEKKKANRRRAQNYCTSWRGRVQAHTFKQWQKGRNI